MFKLIRNRWFDRKLSAGLLESVGRSMVSQNHTSVDIRDIHVAPFVWGWPERIPDWGTGRYVYRNGDWIRP